MKIVKENRVIILVSLAFALLYSLISIVNHYFLRTHALDLGLYTNAAFKYAHLILADSTMIKDFYEPLLGGHFDLYLILFSPLIYVFGTYTLLIVQILAVVTGGVGVYRYFQITGNKEVALYAALYFFLFYGVYSALSFDYHSVVVASSIVPWFFTSVYRNKKVLSATLLLLILIAQENISLWVFFICIGLAIAHRREVNKAALLLAFSIISIGYFIIITSYVIPFFSVQDKYSGFHYSYLGENFFSALKTLFTQPLESFKTLFINHTNNYYGTDVKKTLHLVLLASGLPLLLRKPYYLLMILPLYFQKLFHDNFVMWGTDYQYNIEFAPILAIGVFSAISEFKNVRLRFIVGIVVLLSTALSTRYTMQNKVSFIDKSQVRFYQKDHYQRVFDVKNVHRVLSGIPKTAKVSAQSFFVPHLALRQNIYLFPLTKDAEYIIYRRGESSYPLTEDQFKERVDTLENSEDWEIYHKGEFTVLKKVNF